MPPWIMWPRIEAKMYFPRLVTSRTTSSISTILLPTRNTMPKGIYLSNARDTNSEGKYLEHVLMAVTNCEYISITNVHLVPITNHIWKFFYSPHDPGHQHHGGFVKSTEESDEFFPLSAQLFQCYPKYHGK